MSEISVVVVGSTSISSTVGNGDSVSVNVGDQTIGGGNGAAATVQVGTVTTLGTTASASVVNSGTSYAAKLDFGLPRGLTGATGPANSLSIGSVTTGATAAVTISGSAPSQTLAFVLQPGAAGSAGPANSLSVASVTTGTTAAVSISGTAPSQTLSFVLQPGPTGNSGPANSISIGSVTTGTTAAVSISGTAPSQSLSFVLPAGPANLLSIGSVTTGTTAAVSISGTAPSQTLSFVLQPGPAGASGSTNMSDATPAALGTAAAGTSSLASRSDHVHSLPTISYTALSNVPTSFSPATHTQTASTISDFAVEVAKIGNVLSVNGLTGAVTITAGGGTSGASLSSATPQPLGTAAPGTSSLASRDDHVHLLPTISYTALSNVPTSFSPATHTQTASTISDFATQSALYGPVTSVATRTGAITLVKGDVGLGSVDNVADASKPVSTAQAAADAAVQAYSIQRTNHTGSQLAATISDFATQSALYGPVTSVATRTGDITLVKGDVGLGNVDNVADASKPVSTAQAAADAAVQAYSIQRTNHTGSQLAATISDFAAQSALYGPVTSVASRTGAVSLTKSDVGLSAVDNVADASKPVSTAQAAADAAVQAYSIQRTNHTGSQLASTISDFATQSALYGPVTSVASKTGAVSLVKGDVGLGSVDNVADASKPVSTAQAAADAAVQAFAIQRANHTGTQASSTVSGLATIATSGSASDLSTGTVPAGRIPAATNSSIGGVIVGTGLAVSSGTISANVVSVQGRTGTVTITTTELSAVTSIVSGITGANAVTNVVYLTAAAYAALGTKSSTTLYVVSG